MALVKCRECAKEISSEATTCPHCGAAPKKKMGFIKKSLLTLAGLFIVQMIISNFSDQKSGPQVQAVAAKAPEVSYEFKTTPAELTAAYEANTVAADNRFKGRKYLVQGVVDSINTGIGNDVYITMLSGNMFLDPQFSLDDSQKNAAAKLLKGQQVSMICTGGGDVMKTPMSRRCVFA